MVNSESNRYYHFAQPCSNIFSFFQITITSVPLNTKWIWNIFQETMPPFMQRRIQSSHWQGQTVYMWVQTYPSLRSKFISNYGFLDQDLQFVNNQYFSKIRSILDALDHVLKHCTNFYNSRRGPEVISTANLVMAYSMRARELFIGLGQNDVILSCSLGNIIVEMKRNFDFHLVHNSKIKNEKALEILQKFNDLYDSIVTTLPWFNFS